VAIIERSVSYGRTLQSCQTYRRVCSIHQGESCKRWSYNGTVACVSCHQPDHGWADPQQFSTHANRKPTARRAPTIVNRVFSKQQLWTGLRPSLEEQAVKDSNRTDEMVVQRLGAISAYQQQFRKVFGADLNPDGVAKAIVSIRSILPGTP